MTKYIRDGVHRVLAERGVEAWRLRDADVIIGEGDIEAVYNRVCRRGSDEDHLPWHLREEARMEAALTGARKSR